MHVLFLTRRFYPDIGGVEKHVLKVSEELIRQGHQVSVITESPSSQKFQKTKNYHLKHRSDTYSINLNQAVKSIQTDSFEAEKVSIIRFKAGEDNWFKKFRIWVILVKNIRLLKRVDVIHCHDVFFWYLPFRFLLPAKKIFITFHGFETKFPPSLKAKVVRKISETLSNGNICVGDYIKKWYGTKADFVTYGGVEKPKTLKIRTKAPSKQGKALSILLIGRLEEDNGAKIYLKTLEKLKRDKVSYNLTICGDGIFRHKFDKYGVVKGFTQSLNKYIDRSDFIFASSYLSILEALVRGKNVFSVYQNELKEDYLKLSPFRKYISIADNANSLAKDLILLQKKHRAYNIVNSGQRWALEQTWKKVAGIYLKLWKM